MSDTRAGQNLRQFQAVQMDFAAHIRHPERNPAPEGIEPRRMRIYVDLFYRNIESFLSTTFRVTRTIIPDAEWHAMVRDFVHRHSSESPYFVDIPQEFMEYLDHERSEPTDPPFLLELCHYEWVELDLDISPAVLPSRDAAGLRSGDDLLDAPLVCSPVARSLQYAYPVHKIGRGYRPMEPPAQPTHLIVYRDRTDRVRFMESNVVTARLLQLIAEGNTGRQAVAIVGAELGKPMTAIEAAGTETLGKLIDCDIMVPVEGG